MKTLLFLICLVPAFAIGQIVQINLETLEKVEKQFKKWGGDEEKILISLVSETNVTENKSKKYVQVDISSKDVETEFSNIGLALVGSYSAVSLNTTVETQKFNSSIKIDKKYEPEIVKFLNQTLHKKANAGKNESSMNLNIDQRFTLSFVHANNNSKYFLQLDDAWFAISFDEGILLLKKFIEYLRKA